MLIVSGEIYHFVLANLRWESHDNNNKQVYYLMNKFISYLYNFSCRDQESNLWCKHTYDLLGNSYINGGSLHYWSGIRRCLLKARTIWSVINLYLRETYIEAISLIRYVKLLLISDRLRKPYHIASLLLHVGVGRWAKSFSRKAVRNSLIKDGGFLLL